MKQSPPVSLLIPTHNSARTIADAIKSCVDQTFKDLEILVYDEASRDNTREIIAGFAARDPRIRVMTNDTNSGPLLAWRRLLREARGRWATFIWADDMILPRYVETLVTELQKHPTDLIAGCNAYSYRLSDDPQTKPEPVDLFHPPKDWGWLNQPYATARLRGDAYALGIFAKVYPVTQMCNMYQTEAAREVFDKYIEIPNPHGFDYSRQAYGNDVGFLSEMGLRSGELVQVGDPLVVARATPGSLTERLWHTHRWQYWLQYSWSFYSGWSKCRHLSPRMETLVKLALDRVHFCNIPYAVTNRHWPKHGNPFRAARALWFILRHDRHCKKDAGPISLETFLQRCGKG